MGELSIHKGHVGLQGGGSACAFTAGVLYRLLADPSIEFRKVTGTSGGALCGAAITQAINKFGYTPKGRKIAQQRLVEQWKDIAQPDDAARLGRTIDSMMRLNPFLHHHIKGGYSLAMKSHLQNTTLNPNALQKDFPISLSINAVDKNGKERLFSGRHITTKSLMATGALPSHFHAVRIGQTDYWDGALLGGSNPPIQPLLDEQADFRLFIMTNPPQQPIKARKQSDLNTKDVLNTNGLILHQAYDEIALLLESHEAGTDKTPIHVIHPDIAEPWSAKDKQLVDESIIFKRFKMGIKATEVFLKAHGSTVHEKSSITFEDLKTKAARNHDRLVAA